MMDRLPECYRLDWHGCYDGGWKGMIVDEAFAHPAKFAHGLITRIIDHGLAEGYWRPGDVIGDPFGGVGLGGIVAASRGLRWVGVELEPRFVELGNQNFALHRRTWEACGDPLPLLVQGDSRGFAGIVGELAAVVTSPPYAESLSESGGRCAKATRGEHEARPDDLQKPRGTLAGGKSSAVPYGQTPGQIGALKAGELDAVITSPPYAESVKGDHGETETAEASRAKRRTAGGSLGQSARHGGYGVSEGQIGALRKGELDAVVASPPYTKQAHHGGNTDTAVGVGRNAREQRKCEAAGKHNLTRTYGQSKGQIDELAGESYWQAVAQVYAQVHLALKPGGVLCVVVKDYIKNKARVPLCDDTCRLLESLGFDVFCRTRAWLVKETRTPDLFGGEHVERTERKSFFRRLAERKGSPRIDWEEVIWARKEL